MPYQKAVLSIEDARKALERILQEASKRPQQPIAVAIADDQGELVAFARMDGVAPQPPIIARKKAYTAARTRSDTKAYAERLKSQGRSVSEFGDPMLLALQGGVVIPNPSGEGVLGAIGVSGLTAEEDEALARVGLQAISQR